jgi:riboflavin biosynthesis pyrimidine reductase
MSSFRSAVEHERARPTPDGSRVKLLQRLFEPASPDVADFPLALERLYDGVLRFDTPRLFANFVSSIDGVVALPAVDASPSVISGQSEGDRFVMSLLRASADVVLVGASTVRAEPEHRWTPEFVYPRASVDFARLRDVLGLGSEPRLAVVTAGGNLDPSIPALARALIVTTPAGARRVGNELPSGAEVVVVGGGDHVDLADVVTELRTRGHERVLSEGGPTVVGQLLERGLVDELFLTISPVLLGRTRAEGRPGLVEGVDLLGIGAPPAQIISVRKHRSHLFLRYSLAEVSEKAHSAHPSERDVA